MEWCSHCERFCNTACHGSFLCCRECGKVLTDVVVKKMSGRSGKNKSTGVKRDGRSSSQACCCCDEESSNVS